MNDRPNIKCIDTHVHFRDWEEDYKETIRGGSEKAAKQRIIAVGDMPNTIPPILLRKSAIRRLETAVKEKPLVKYFLWIGMIPNRDQIEEAVKAVREIPEVLGIKLYAGPTTNALGVNSERKQKMIYQALTADLDYQGVLAVHCEKQKELRPKLWDPKIPWSHNLARPPKAEIESVKDQIKFAKETNFSGHLHICHISQPETLSIVQQARENGLDISGEVTPHHLLLSELNMVELNRMYARNEGLMLKVNPPLSTLPAVEELREKVIQLVQKEVDWLWLATDYAPHTLKEKLKPQYLSGIADFSLYGQILTRLNEEGLSWEQIERLTYHNIIKAFGEKFKGIGEINEEVK
ncbi:MAG: hypothetical protein WBC21_02040 [Minisyncoccales bacterium]